MFKKTILATALSAATLGMSAAVVNVAAPDDISLEGAVNEASITAQDVVVTLGAEYTLNDTVTFTVSGAEFDVVNSAPAIASTMADSANDAIVTGLLSITANTVTFRVTAVTDGDSNGVVSNGGTITLSGMEFDTASVVDATGEIDVTYSAQTNTSLPLDNAGTLTDVWADVVEQFSITATKAFNGVIDVEANRLLFTAGDDSTTTDVAIVTTNEAAVDIHDAAYDGITHVFTGDFSWMETDGTAGIDAGELGAAVGVVTGGDDVCTAAINTTSSEITVTCADGGANAVEAQTVTFTANGEVLPVQTITAEIVLDYTPATGAADTKTVLAAGSSVGAWTLNGSQVSVPYMPYGSVITQIIYATNEGTQTGTSVADLTFEDGTTATCALGSIAPGTTALAGTIRACVEGAIGAISQKVAMSITTNVPSGDMEVYTAYNVNSDGGNGDRVTVPNSSTHGLAATID
jgi:hypothetical protein